MIDFHCHLDLYSDLRTVVHGCVARSIYVLSVTTTPSAWAGTSALAAGSDRIRTALGFHPQLAHERKSELPLFVRLLPETRYVGEIGLDGTPEYKKHWRDQLLVFEGVLDACKEHGGRILSIHSRRAAGPVLDVLTQKEGAGVPVLHWFSGSLRDLNRAKELGCWFSVGPTMLCSEKGRQLVALMPRTRVVTETDGPFAQVDKRPALPWDVAAAITALGELWREPEHAVCDQLLHNLRGLVTMAAPGVGDAMNGI